MTNLKMISTSALALSAVLAAGAATAQDVFAGADVAETQNEDLRDAIESDAERDLGAFGNEGRTEGFSGSVALRSTATTGNSDSLDLGIGADLNYVMGPNGFGLALSYTYGEEDGAKTEESLYYGLEYTRDFTPNFFGFAKAQGSVDEFSSFTSDTFVSFGAGYRIYNDANTQWSVQGGPGYRVAKLSDVATGDIDEAAFGISSDYAQRLSQDVFLTNDTDVISSESDTVVYNDLALNVSLTDAMALRTSVLTEYHSDPEPGFKDTDNTLGVSLVYSFN